MDIQTDNRRVRMTKRLLKNALLELLEQNKLADISVTALCEAADVHRSTFYKHYSDPADVLIEIEQDFLDQIPAPPQVLDRQNQDQLLAATTAFFDYIKENGKILRILFDESTGSSFAAKLVKFLCSGFIPLAIDTDEFSSHFIRLYIANGTVGMMREWVTAGFPISSQKIAEMMFFLSRKIAT